MKRGGFTLLEALITVLILGSLTGVVFMVFAVGASAFRVGNNRLDLQSDLRRVLTPLRRDLENTSFQSISATTSEVDTPQNPPAASPTVLARRDGICMNALRDSLSDASYAPGTGLPNWDGFLLYFATRDNPDGRMVRLVLKDPTPGVLSVPRNLAAADLSLANPDVVSGEARILSDQILDFRVTLDSSNQLVNLSLKFRTKAGHQSLGGRSLIEVLEIDTSIDPANTNPRL